MKNIFVFLALSSITLVFSEPSFTQKQMLNDIESITNIFEISYAPSTWKSEHFGWDLEFEKSRAKNAVLEHPNCTVKQFQKIIKDFCLSTRDYHVIPFFYSTEHSFLPFHIQKIKDKYFVSHVDQDAKTPLQVGDQILIFNGTPIKHAFEAFASKEMGSNNANTDKAFGEFFFTNRFGSLGFEVPQGEVEIIYYSSSRKLKACSLLWNYSDELITEVPFRKNSKSFMKSKKPNKKKHFKKQFISPHYHLIRSVYADNNEFSDLLGSRKSRIPPLGPIIWESEDSHEFHAYLFELNSKKIGGYIRIPSYDPNNAVDAALEFGNLIKILQEFSDVLVIDQLNNGGGGIFYLYALIAMLSDRELEVPMHRIRITQKDIYNSFKYNSFLESLQDDQTAREYLGETVEGTVVNCKLIQSLIHGNRFIIDQWNQGKIDTDFYYLYGIEKIQPHPEINYKKPILILTNGLDLSAADFFPAIMQDNRRAIILGTRTAGAGGYVEQISFSNLNGIEKIGITASFSIRKNGMPIENVGVKPDIVYEVSELDLQYNYVEYKYKILNALKHLVYPNKRKRKWKSQ